MEELLKLVNPIISRPAVVLTPCSGRFEDMAEQGSLFDRTTTSELATAAADGRLQDTFELVAAGQTVADVDPDAQLSALLVWAYRGCSDSVQAVLPASVFPNSLDATEALRAVVIIDDLLLVEALFNAGVDANISTVWGETAIMSARSIEMFDYLLSHTGRPHTHDAGYPAVSALLGEAGW